MFKLHSKIVFRFTQLTLLFITITLQLYESVDILCFKFRLNINLQQLRIVQKKMLRDYTQKFC